MENSARPPEAAIDAFLTRGGDLLATTDRHGRITWFNNTFGTDVGSADVAIGMRLGDLVHTDTPAAALTALQTGLVDGTGCKDLEIALVSRDRPGFDSPLWCQVSCMPFDGSSAAGCACVFRDWRLPRHQQHEAQRLAELLETAQEFGRLGVWERDVRTGEGRWDDHVFRFFDMAPSEGTPNHAIARERIHPEDRVDDTYARSILQPGRYSRRYRVVGVDGVVRTIHSQWEVKSDSEGQPSRAIGIMVDDSEAYEMAHSLTRANVRLQLAMELSGIALWRHDLLTGRLHYDPQVSRILGWEPRPEGWTIEEARAQVHPDDLPAVADAVRRSLESNLSVDLEVRYRHADGSWRTVLTRRTVERDSAGVPIGFIGVGLDVTDRIESARASIELGRRLEAITRAAGLGVWSASLDSDHAEWNRRMFELYDLPHTERPPAFLAFVELRVHPADQAEMKRAGLAWLRSRRGAFEMEFRAVLTDGSVRWVLSRADMDLRGGEHLIYGIAIDITERKGIEFALQEARERVTLAAHGAGIGTWLHDPRSGTTFWDEQMFLLRGLAPAPTALTVEERLAITHPDDREPMLAALRSSELSGESATYEFRIRLPDGQWRWLASRSIPTFDSAGEFVRQTGVNWDVTEARTSEFERQERMAAQRENQAKSKFLARISHELRTPLNAILGFSQLLLGDEGRASVAQRRSIEHIRFAGEHLLSLINDVLELSSLQSGELKLQIEAVSLRQAVGEALNLLTSQAAAGRIALNVDTADFTVWADATRVRQIVINLVSNAIKYNREGGEVFISARPVDGARVLLSVRDTGIGIDPGQVPHLFEPFNRLGMDHSGIEGTGIGLAVVKSIAERLGGQVSVASTPGVGSEFTVTFESAQAARAPGRRLPSAMSPLASGHGPLVGKLLYIEDNPVNVLIVEELIRRFPGLTLLSAPDGSTGVAIAGEFIPDLVLTDMALPDFDGFEVLRRLRADPRTAGIPCVALSANAMPEDIALALRSGMADYWTKPIDFAEFTRALSRLLGPRQPEEGAQVS